MKDELFKELLESVKQGGAIMRGEMKPGRVFKSEQPDVQLIRKNYGFAGVPFTLSFRSK